MESKSSSALREDRRRSDAAGGPDTGGAPVRGFVRVLPVVEQNVRRPHLLGGEAEVPHAGMLALVPLEVVVEPALQTQTQGQDQPPAQEEITIHY